MNNKKFKLPLKWRMKIKYMHVNNIDKEQLLHRVKFSKMRIIQHRKYRRIVKRKSYRALNLVFEQ